MRVYSWWLTASVVLTLSSAFIACQSGEEDPLQTTTAPTSAVASSPTSSTSPEAAPSATTTLLTLTPTPLLEGPLLHLNLLARLKPDDIEDTQVEDIVWIDGCMELSELDLCMLDYGNGPGQRVTFTAGGEEWVYHIGPGGFLFAGTLGHPLEQTLADVRRHLSEWQSVETDEIQTSKIEKIVWTGNCLDLPTPPEAGPCTGPLGYTTGFRITLLAGGKEYIYHADRWGRWGYDPNQ